MPKLKIAQRKSLLRRTLQPFTRSKKSRLVLLALAMIAAISFVLLVLPYVPKLRFWISRPKIDATPYAQAASDKTRQDQPPVQNPDTKEKGNRLVIPSIGVNAEVIEGANIWVIAKNQGVWHETRGTNPTKPGNIVLAGHRWLYTTTNGGYFYNLPEVKIDDKIYYIWEKRTYEYQVYNRKTVQPTQIDIRDSDPSVPNKLTLYTCYPLGSTAKRFVIEAKLIK